LLSLNLYNNENPFQNYKLQDINDINSVNSVGKENGIIYDHNISNNNNYYSTSWNNHEQNINELKLSQMAPRKYVPKKEKALKHHYIYEKQKFEGSKVSIANKKSIFVTTKNKRYPTLDTLSEINEAKKQSRLLKNRTSANKSREKKRNYIENLEERVIYLQNELNNIQTVRLKESTLISTDNVLYKVINN